MIRYQTTSLAMNISEGLNTMRPDRTQAIRTAICMLITLTISASADQQVVYPPSAMPRVDMHTHMDAKIQYAKSVEAMDQWAAPSASRSPVCSG